MSVKLKVNDTQRKHIYLLYVITNLYIYYYACRSDITFERRLKICPTSLS